MTTILKLGSVDQNADFPGKKAFLEPYHAGMAPALQNRLQFRDEATWRDFSPVPDNEVRELQTFLKKAGFMPKAKLDGVFGYATQASTRLFQEYIRTVIGDTSIGVPDGVVGPKTWGFAQQWKKGAVCEWAKFTPSKSSPEFKKWIKLLSAAKKHFTKVRDTQPILKLVEQFDRPTDTIKVRDWIVDGKTIHLIGIRREQEALLTGVRRANDDLFILLINGMVFKFWGSTDPSPDMADRADIPFLVESQHEYRFSWHKMSEANKVYQALRPAGPGVLVFRDANRDRALTDTDIARGLDAKPNTTINIHWSGIGSANFSAGCQVLAGNGYMNHRGETIDCSAFAALNQRSLGKGKTRGAYNLFADLVLSYAPEGVQTLRYLLGRDETFQNFKNWDEAFVATDVDKLRRSGLA